MPGTAIGGQHAATTNKAKYGDDFYKRIGANGGKASGTGGFSYLKRTGQLEKIQAAGRKGGHISRRGPGIRHIITIEIPHQTIFTRIKQLFKGA